MTELLDRRPLNPSVPEVAQGFTRALVENGGGGVVAVLLYGSQLHRSSPDRYSAWDLAVVVDDYSAFHLAMRDHGHQRRNPALMSLMGRVLPPYVTAFNPPGMGSGLAKCLVLSESQFQRALGPRAQDHFMKGRFVQHVEVVWTASPEHETRIQAALEEARKDVLAWAGPFLEEPFDAASLTQRMLEVSFGAELRPETSGRAMEVWRSQEGWLKPTYGRVLSEAAERGELTREPDGRFRFRDTPGRWQRMRARIYFARSKVRGTARWAKHVVTFNDWLPYVKRKVERRTGLTIELTPAEERWPLILLWPKAIWVLRHGKAEQPEEENGI